jgi:hypothetical protein
LCSVESKKIGLCLLNSASGDELDQQHDESNNQQNVDVPRHHMEADEAD